MQLLSPEQIKGDRVEGITSTQIRIAALGREEQLAVSRLNDAKDTDAKERSRITEDFNDFAFKIEQQKALLQGEVEELERRRVAALKPIKDLHAEAIQVMGYAKIAKVVVDEHDRDLVHREMALKDRLEDVLDRESELDTREEQILQREKALTGEEERLRVGSNTLQGEWTRFYSAVAAKNAELLDRESKVAAETKANEAVRIEQEARQVQQDEKDREIADRYATLVRSTEEINTKHQNHGTK